MKQTASLLLVALVALVASFAHAGDWPHWRGPNYNGSTDETNLPTTWSQTENIRWVADLPGPSAATPIVCRDRVFISSTAPDTKELFALCFKVDGGKLLWSHKVADVVRRDTRSTFAAPSPVTDGNVVVFFYGSGPMVAYDFAGKELWKRNIEKDYGQFAFQWTFSSSPLIYGGKLYLQVLQRDVPARGYGMADRKNVSYLLAMNPATGETLWKVERPSKARAESREAFTSPIPFEFEGREELLVVGGDCLTGHDPETGKELWRWGTWNPTRIEHWRLVPSPVASKDIILACAPKRDPIYAIKAGGNGTLDDSAIAWVSRDNREVASDVPTPAFYDGDFFVVHEQRPTTLARVEPPTGTVKWTTQLPRGSGAKMEASPLAADGKIYLVNHSGLVVIVDAENGKIINQIPMAESEQSPVRSTIVAARGYLFLRTNDKLYCIGKRK